MNGMAGRIAYFALQKKNGYALPKALLHRHGSVDYVVYAFLSTPPSGEN